ncbi:MULTISPECIES: transcriptional regulator [Pseudomonas]|uniref:transcriptional regulator n=1 Tax=Pseudomonas TaxID=286 RepID=UPI000CD1D11A|nr:transcriptional regulator [Pseudomonas sp. FW305-3-2-15-E-TSA4]POA41971.1 transcriptional regulator [Pseudomonas sp. FW305-3-2-15-E-TSA2]
MTYCVKDAELCRQALEKVIKICGNNQSELARRCNVKQPHVWKWVRAGRVPTERVHSVAKASEGKVLPHELRPDLPDLFPAPAPAPAPAISAVAA